MSGQAQPLKELIQQFKLKNTDKTAGNDYEKPKRIPEPAYRDTAADFKVNDEYFGKY